MAIYHLNANVISRARGQSIVAAAAYRFGAKLRDERYGVVHNYLGKRVTAHAEIMAPPGSPTWVYDRESLWNRVEAAERRRDSQLARVIEIGLPVELIPTEAVALVRDYSARIFVAAGMIADFCIRRDNPDNPHAHILLTLRGVTLHGFGPKERRWNGKSNLLLWRSSWAALANEHLARAGHPVRIDHRTLEAQQIELTPARRMGVGRTRPGISRLPDHLLERIAEQQRIARDNGAAILEDPSVALRAITHLTPTFTLQDLQRFLRSRTADEVQFDAACLAVTQSPDLVALASDGVDAGRFTSRDMIEAAKSLKNRAVAMAGRHGHAVTAHNRDRVRSRLPQNDELRRVFDYLVNDGDAKAVVVDAQISDVLLDAAREAWSADGLQVCGVAPQTLSEHEGRWQVAGNIGDRELTRASVVLVEGADLLGLKQLERLLAAADHARAKVVLVADSVRLPVMGGDAPIHGVLRDIGWI